MNIYTVIHFSLMGLALILLISAILTARKKAAAGWFAIHRMLALMGVLSALAAFVAMFYFKSSMNYTHFKSPHALWGLVTVIMVLATPVMGYLAATGNARFQKTHRMFGRATMALMVITLIFGILRIVQILNAA